MGSLSQRIERLEEGIGGVPPAPGMVRGPDLAWWPVGGYEHYRRILARFIQACMAEPGTRQAAAVDHLETEMKRAWERRVSTPESRANEAMARPCVDEIIAELERMTGEEKGEE